MRLKLMPATEVVIPAPEVMGALWAGLGSPSSAPSYSSRSEFQSARRRSRIQLGLAIALLFVAAAISIWAGLVMVLLMPLLLPRGPWGSFEQHIALERIRDEIERDGKIATTTYSPAGITKRWIAELIDLTLQFAPLVVTVELMESASDGAIAVAGAYAFAYPLVTTKFFGRTVGKWLFGLRVHRALGDPSTLLWIVRRELIVKRLLLLIFGPLTLWTAVVADAVSPYFDERRRAGHDRIMLSFVTEE